MVGAPADSRLAYSLWRHSRGWSWSVYDAEGAVVGVGFAETRDEAEKAISEIYRTSQAELATA